MNGQQLSAGALAQVLAQDQFAGTMYVQVLDVQHIVPKDANSVRRTKILISDSMYKCTALMATQVKDLVDSGAVQRGSILEVREAVGNKKIPAGAADKKKLIIILNVSVVGNVPEQIGNPVLVPDDIVGPPPMQQQQGNMGMAPNGAGPGGFVGGPGGYGAPPANGANGGGMYGGPPNGAAGGPPNGANGMYGAPPGGMQQQGGGGMYGQQQQQQQQQQGGGPPPYGGGGGGPGMYGGPPSGPQYGGGHGPVTQSNDAMRIIPIANLNPYLSRWTIKARVTQKGDVRRWQNPRNEGKLMSFDLVDKEGTEIRATAWNDQVDQYQDLIQVGRVITISKASLKPRNPKFNNTAHQFEIYLERSSLVQPCDDDQEAAVIPYIMFNFKHLNELEHTEAGAVVDVIGVLDSVEPWALITRKDGTETRKRAICLRDDSGRSVEVTLWDKFTSIPGDQLENALREGQHPVVAIKAARVGDFNGKSLSTLGSSTVVVEPDRPEAGKLRSWYDSQGGASMVVAPLSERGGGGGRQDRRVTFSQIENEGIGMNGQAEWVMVNGTVHNISSDRGLAYPACTRDFNGRPCQKKLQGQEGSWYCERCNAPCEQPSYRFLISLQAQDHTGSETLTAFGESGEVIMGCTAEQVANPHAMDSAAYGVMVQQRLFSSYNFKLKVFQDSYNDEQRRKISISKLVPIDYVAEGRQLVDFIHKLDAGQPIMGPQAAGGARGGSMMGGGGPGPAPQQQYGGGPAGGGPAPMQSPYGGGGGGGMYGGPGAGPPGNNMGGGGAGGYGGPPGGGMNGGPAGGYGGGGFQQQPQPGGNAWGVGGGGGGGWNGGGNQQGPGGFQQQQQYGQQQQYNQPPQQQQQYNQQPFNAGWA